jgi:hypothetical protein
MREMGAGDRVDATADVITRSNHADRSWLAAFSRTPGLARAKRQSGQQQRAVQHRRRSHGNP